MSTAAEPVPPIAPPAGRAPARTWMVLTPHPMGPPTLAPRRYTRPKPTPRHRTQKPDPHRARQLRPPGCVDPWRSPDPATDARDDETATRPSNATATKLATRIGSLSSVPFREDGGDEADSESPPHLLRQLRTFLVAERAGPADLVDRSALVRGGTASQIVGQLVCV